MKKLLVFLLLIVGVAVAWVYFTRPPDPVKERAKAQRYLNSVANYWLKCAREDRLEDMQAVCLEGAQGQSEMVLLEIHELEDQIGEEYKDFHLTSMGAKGAYMALLSAEDAGMILRLTMLIEKQGEKYWIASVASE